MGPEASVGEACGGLGMVLFDIVAITVNQLIDLIFGLEGLKRKTGAAMTGA
jgi:hypothetical protein